MTTLLIMFYRAGTAVLPGCRMCFPDCAAAGLKLLKNGMEKVSEIQKTVDILMGIYSVGKPFVPYIKKAMNIIGLPVKEYCTPPMPKVTDSEAEQIRNILEKAGMLN